MHTSDVVEKIRVAPDINSLWQLVDSHARHVGMDGAYLMHFHPASGLTAIDRRPEEWLRVYSSRGFIHFDPIAIRAFKGGEAFTWDECISRSNLNREQRMLMSQARDFGLLQGFNVQGMSQGYEAYTCSYYNRHYGDYADTMRANRKNMEIVGEAARSRMSELILEGVDVPELTPREKECLELAAAGKTNDVIGAILGISANTVGGYIKSASKKLQVNSKVQAIVKAVQLRIIFPVHN